MRASAAGALRGRAAAPGDKSISHRALILGALAEGETEIRGLLESSDVLATARAVRAFGARAERVGDGVWRVGGAAWKSPAEAIDCGNSGTAARLLMGAASGFPIEAEFTGDSSLRERPMGRVIEPLARMGARFDGSDRLPVRLSGGSLSGIRHVARTASAQVKSAILLAGLRSDGPVEIVEPAPSRDHMETMLRAFGCEVEVALAGFGRIIRLGERRALAATAVEVPGDPSSAAFPLVAALITPGSEVTVEGVMVNALRAGLFGTLIEMGADLAFTNCRTVGGESVADVTARASRLRGVEVPAARAPSMIDEYPILAVAAAFADGETAMLGIGELRVKESDRVKAILDGLEACGVGASAQGDTLRVAGGGGSVRGGAEVASRGDHRIAMSFLTLGLAAREPVSVDRTEAIATSFPAFVPLMRSLGASIHPCPDDARA
ncbi:MAG TPA: 3-phosphoshikimate 1-carboxyvinyltransferase [Allosphingosinicella sp.]|jgi:3-phosphoshikimate 1-carboxyvinyltransferase